jgi:hypothetical protein
MLGGIGCDQARIHGKDLHTNKVGCNACANDALEHVAEDLVAAEALVAGTRERYVISRSPAMLERPRTSCSLGAIAPRGTGRDLGEWRSRSQLARASIGLR